MAISIEWHTKIISVPKDYLNPTANPSVFNLDTDQFRLDLKALEDDETGIVYLDTHRHNTEVLLSGVTYARVIEIINGYTITFENGFYAINFYGSNNNYADVTNVNFVSIRPNNSAGLIVDPSIEEALHYGGEVWFDSVHGFSGSLYPVGTSSKPVNNNNDLLSIIERLNAHEVNTLSNMKLTFDIAHFEIRGGTPGLIFDPNGHRADFCKLEQLILSGSFNHSFIFAKEVGILHVENVHGVIRESFLSGYLSISDGENLNVIECHSGISGSDSPVLDMTAGESTTLSLRKYSGGIQILNCDTVGSIATLEVLTGKIHLDPTCTDGYISARGGSGVLLDVVGGGNIEDLGTYVDTTALHIGTTATFDPNTIVSASLFGVQEQTLYDIDNTVEGIETILLSPVTASLVADQSSSLHNIENYTYSSSVDIVNLLDMNTSQSLQLDEMDDQLDVLESVLIDIQTSTTGSVISDNMIREVWELHGLDITKPLTVTQTKRLFGIVDQDIVTTGTGSAQETTITRN